MADMTLEEALAAATVDEELVTPVNEVLMINPETRTINVPDSEKLFGVRQDMSVERKYFKCPRIVGDNIDLFEHYVFVNYIPSDQNGKYESEKDVQGYWCKDLAVEGDFITFSWELTENVLRKAGYIAFAVYAKVSDENGNLKTKWHTTIAIGNVLDTLPDGEEWITIYPDIVTQLLERMDAVEKIANPESMQKYVDDYFNRNPMMIDRELKDETKAAPADIVGKLSEDIATKASAIKETASGEVIVVTDSDEAKPLGLAIDGKSEQNQYSGKNLLKSMAEDTKTHNGITWTKNPDGSIRVTGTKTGYAGNICAPVDAKPLIGKTLVLKGISVNFRNGVKIIHDDGTETFVDNDNCDVNFVFTIPETAKTVAYNCYVHTSSVIDETIYPQLENDTVSTDYEPFVGGIPSPNPSYPQEIRNIGVYDEASGKYAVEVKCTGKNKLDISKITSSVKVSVEVENETISATGKDSWAISNYVLLPVIAGKQYIVSVEKITGGNIPAISIRRNSDGKGIKDLGTTGETTLKIPDGETHVRVMFIVNGASTALSEATTATFVKPMIRLAEITDNTYEPYKETTATVYLDEPLRKGDKAYWNGGSKVRIDRYRAVEVFDGSDDEKWNIDVSGATRFGFSLLQNSIKVVSNHNALANMLCDQFVEKTANETYLGENGVSVQTSGTIYFRDGVSENIATWKARLAENPITLEYPLATPITEEIDINLDELSMFYPTTILSNDCNANMEVEYIADTKAYIDKKFAELATAMV